MCSEKVKDFVRIPLDDLAVGGRLSRGESYPCHLRPAMCSSSGEVSNFEFGAATRWLGDFNLRRECTLELIQMSDNDHLVKIGTDNVDRILELLESLTVLRPETLINNERP